MGRSWWKDNAYFAGRVYNPPLKICINKDNLLHTVYRHIRMDNPPAVQNLLKKEKSYG